MKLLKEGTEIYYTGDMANSEGFGKIVHIHKTGNYGPDYEIEAVSHRLSNGAIERAHSWCSISYFDMARDICAPKKGGEMSENDYANGILVNLQYQLVDASGCLKGILESADEEQITRSIEKLADLGQKLLSELHRRGKTYQQEAV